MLQDIRFAFRLLARSPAFAAAALLSLAIGIGASTAVFTLINAALLKPLPYPDVERLVVIRTDQSQHFSVPGSIELAAHSDAIEHLTAIETLKFVIGDGQPEQVHGQLVSPAFGALIGLNGPLRPVVWRAFSPDEFEPGRDRVVLLSHRLWTRRYGGAGDIVGRVISIDAAPATVIGVLPAHFDLFATGDLLAPLALGGARINDRFYRSLEVIGRLKPQRGAAQVAAQLKAAVTAAPGEEPPAIRLDFVRELLVQDFTRTLFTMWAVAALVLLIGCCNFANLLSARTLSRAHELAVRTALGAKRRRVTRQLATEALLLGALGGIVGLIFAVAGRNLLVAATPQHFLGVSTIAIDWRVVSFAIVIALATRLIFGLAPALRASATDGTQPVWPGTSGGAIGPSASIRDLAGASRHGVSTDPRSR